ncbi:MAG: hypothetical protein WCI67_13885 [Chloroflexales bacterium]
MQRYPDETAGLVLVEPGDYGTGRFAQWLAAQPLSSDELQRDQEAYAQLQQFFQSQTDSIKGIAPLAPFGIARLLVMLNQLSSSLPPELQDTRNVDTTRPAGASGASLALVLIG